MKRSINTVLAAIFILCLLAVLPLSFVGWNQMTCRMRGDDMQRKTKWTVMSGCLVEADKGWLPVGQARDE